MNGSGAPEGAENAQGGQPEKRRSTAERRGNLHAALVDAAERLIETDGVDAVKARALALAAGCSVGAIYNAVTDLDTIVLEANARTLSAIDALLREVSSRPSDDPSPAARLSRLSLAYLAYAAANRSRWTAVFAHRMSDGNPVPPWYLGLQASMFTHVEASLGALRPDLAPEDLSLLARTLFSAVHGAVSLGLNGTLVSLPLEVQQAQLGTLVRAIARGLTPPENTSVNR